MSSEERPEAAAAVYAFVRTVPPGKVVTYGQIAGCVEGVRVTARQVGGIMSMCPEDVPWHRVVGAGGHLPLGKRTTTGAMLQRSRLEAEGVAFLQSGRIDMARCQWVDVPGPQGLFGE